MVQQLSHEVEVKVPANEAWKVFGTLRLARLAVEELPNIYEKIEVIEGDGGAGTVLKITLAPGTPGFTGLTEKFTTIDNEKRLKEAEIIEGGFIDLGFTFYRARLEVIEKDEDSCIIKITIEYDVKEEAAANVSYVKIERPVKLIEIVNNYLIKSKAAKDVNLVRDL